MSGDNGFVTITRKGRVKFKFCDENETVLAIVAVDVIRASDEWNEIDWSFREADGAIIKGKRKEHREASLGFVRDLIRNGFKNSSEEERRSAELIANSLSDADVLDFHTKVAKECKKLQYFFSVDSGDEPSPVASSDVTYSE